MLFLGSSPTRPNEVVWSLLVWIHLGSISFCMGLSVQLLSVLMHAPLTVGSSPCLCCYVVDRYVCMCRCIYFIHCSPSLPPHAIHIQIAKLRHGSGLNVFCPSSPLHTWGIREGSNALMGHNKEITGVKQNVLKIQIPSAPAILSVLWYRTPQGPQLWCLINNLRQTETLAVSALSLKRGNCVRVPNAPTVLVTLCSC
jgi:hypothetical protein